MEAVAQPGSRLVAQPDSRRDDLVSRDVGPAVVSVRGLTRTYTSGSGTLTAIDDLNFDIRKGEFLAIVGPSGCGKTTLLRMLAGLDTPTAGTIAMDPPTLRNAMIFQGRSVFPWMTVRENIGYGLKLRGTPRRERDATVSMLLETIGIAQFGASYPHQLSEGMRQRVAIARALAVDPDLLLMDEPFSSLDEQTKVTLQDEVLRLWERSGKTVVFITHSIDEALVLGDRVIVMSQRPGTIRAIVPVQFPRPRNFLAVRSDPAFSDVFARIWGLLREDGSTP